ncbi:hypothetical protein [Methanobrevibacter sp.]|uniref:hypothetical protein n=1 Tax=Methanobrevibacter sp. TaxID=66852 RepID=UPI00388E09A2
MALPFIPILKDLAQLFATYIRNFGTIRKVKKITKDALKVRKAKQIAKASGKTITGGKKTWKVGNKVLKQKNLNRAKAIERANAAEERLRYVTDLEALLRNKATSDLSTLDILKNYQSLNKLSDKELLKIAKRFKSRGGLTKDAYFGKVRYYSGIDKYGNPILASSKKSNNLLRNKFFKEIEDDIISIAIRQAKEGLISNNRTVGQLFRRKLKDLALRAVPDKIKNAVDLFKKISKGDIKGTFKDLVRNFAPNTVKVIGKRIFWADNVYKGLTAQKTIKDKFGNEIIVDDIDARKNAAKKILILLMKLPMDRETRSAIFQTNQIINTGKAAADYIYKLGKVLMPYDLELDFEDYTRERDYTERQLENGVNQKQQIEEEQDEEKKIKNKKEQENGERRKGEEDEITGKKKEEDKQKQIDIIPNEENKYAMSWDPETGHTGIERSFAIDKYRFVKRGDFYEVYYNYRKKKRAKGTNTTYFVSHPKQYSFGDLNLNEVKWLETASSKGRAFRALKKIGKAAFQGDNTSQMAKDYWNAVREFRDAKNKGEEPTEQTMGILQNAIDKAKEERGRYIQGENGKLYIGDNAINKFEREKQRPETDEVIKL